MASIHSIGTARPANSLSQDEAAMMAVTRCEPGDRRSRLLPQLYRKSQVQRRGIALLQSSGTSDDDGAVSTDWFYGGAGEPSPKTAARMEQFRRLAPPLAVEACDDALQTGGVSASEITHLIVVTCTGFAAPGIDFELIRQLGLPHSVRRTQIGFMGCHAALNALAVAAAFAKESPKNRVLICCVELCSLHFQYGPESDQVVANALFADGAAAVVVGPDDDATHWRIADAASYYMQGTEGDMSWHVGDHGFEMTLSTRVPTLIAQHLRPWLDGVLAQQGLLVSEINTWAIHAGGPRIVSAVAERLGLPEHATEASRSVLRDCGNMSSGTSLFILKRLHEQGSRPPAVMLAFGPGLAVEAIVLK